MTIAVLGATGFIGRSLVPALAERADVVAVSRHGDAPEGENVRAVAGDATDPAAMRRALEGVDVVYYLVHSLGAAEFSEIDRRAATTVAAAAEAAGVSQIVFLGGLGDDAPDLSPHLRSRAETAAVLVAGAVPVTILRAAVVVGQGSAGFETIV
ncbi:MAG TPA: NAD(P)H-binding protein, partial [Gaiella sp.]|nr:NAD(P)H-binding protein [Gaiella sp.]